MRNVPAASQVRATCCHSLRAILTTVVEDSLIPGNSCVSKFAGGERAEKSGGTPAQVWEAAGLARSITAR